MRHMMVCYGGGDRNPANRPIMISRPLVRKQVKVSPTARGLLIIIITDQQDKHTISGHGCLLGTD